jgi:TolB-like protein
MRHTDRQETLPTGYNRVFASLFGDFQLTAADGTEIVISNRRARALLAMLCLVREESIDRDYLSKLLWPGRFEAHAKASLRQCLFDLGKLLAPHGTNILNVTRNRVGLNPSAIQTDLGNLENALIREQYSDVADHLISVGPNLLLDQMDLSDAFNGWLAKHRLEVELRLQTAVTDGLAVLEKDGNTAVHTDLQNAWMARDLSMGQGADTEKVTGKVRIAVLPFHSPDAKEGNDYFADGMVDELITTLGQVPQLLVAGRTSSFHFRGSELASPGIADALGVSHLIEGSVQRQGEKVRIFVRLIDGVTGFESWGRRYDGSLGDIFALQETVAHAVTNALAANLDLVIDEPPVRDMTRSKDAYELYLQGQSLCARRFGEGVLDSAINLFERSLSFDPDFAECWAALAEAHQLVSVYTQCLDRNAEAARMADCARRAIALSPQLAYPYALLGLHELTRFNFVGALDYAYQAYHLEPNNPAVAMRLGSFLLFVGRTRDAMPYLRAALDQDPVDGRKYALFCGAQLCTGDLEAANEAALRMVDLGMPSTLLGLTSAALGNRDLAIEQYLKTQQMVNSMILPPIGIGVQTPEAMNAYWLIAANAICGGSERDRQTYWHVLEMLYAVLHDKSDLSISGPGVLTGNAALVFKTVGHSITPSNLIAMVPLWADIDPIRQIWQHPEFIPFAQRIGMAAAWDKYGWPDLLPPPTNF